jgi:hypothetical protein
MVAVFDAGTVRLEGGVAAGLGSHAAGVDSASARESVLPELARPTRVEGTKLGERASLRGPED